MGSGGGGEQVKGEGGADGERGVKREGVVECGGGEGECVLLCGVQFSWGGLVSFSSQRAPVESERETDQTSGGTGTEIIISCGCVWTLHSSPTVH